MTYYAYTVKRVVGEADSITHQNYHEYIHNTLCNVHKSIEIIDHAYEKDTLGRLHMHLFIRAPRKLFLKKLRPVGWNIDVQELATEQDIRRWATYLMKDDFKQYAFKEDEISLF